MVPAASPGRVRRHPVAPVERGSRQAPYRGGVAAQDGNGWVACRCGVRHWGRYGAAGLLLVRRPGPQVLLQLRAAWTHEGGSWAVPGGARDSHEDVVAAALREAHEEAGVEADRVDVLGELLGVDHTDWRYTYVVALAAGDLTLSGPTAESEEIRWVDTSAVAELSLHPGFAGAWPRLRSLLAPS